MGRELEPYDARRTVIVVEAESEAQSIGGPAATLTSEVIEKIGPENRPEAATELLRAEAGDIQGTTVAMERAGAESVSAERVIMTNSGARTVEARSAQIDRSGILAVTSEKAVFYNSSAIAVAVEEARIVRSRVFMLKTGHAVIDGGTRIGIYAGPAGDLVRPLIDLRGAAAFGAGMGAILLLFGSLLRRMFRAR